MHTDTPRNSNATPIDTLELAAIIVAGYVSQGRIGPTNANDHEAETLLAQLGLLVRQQEERREN